MNKDGSIILGDFKIDYKNKPATKRIHRRMEWNREPK